MISHEIESLLLGLVCNNVKLRNAYSLLIRFGEELLSVKNNRTIKHFECELITDICSWRLEKNNQTVYGSYDDERTFQNVFNNIASLTITKIESDIAGDLVIEFGEEYRLKLLCVSSNAPLFSVYYKNEIFEYLPKGIWVKIDSEKISKLTSEEERISDHAYDCYERWSKIVPNELSDAFCNECIYYRPLMGEFYFWDFGLCSNSKSLYDGKVINIKSSCKEHSKTYETQ